MIRKRKRKSGEQLKALVREFDRNPNWTKDTLLEVSRKTGLSEAQVYKWGWDQKRKKYGPEAAALMMAGCSGFASSSSYKQPAFTSSETSHPINSAYNTTQPENIFTSNNAVKSNASMIPFAYTEERKETSQRASFEDNNSD